MNQQERFEAFYADQHGVPVETMASYRMEDTYRLPAIASHYRTFKAAEDGMKGQHQGEPVTDDQLIEIARKAALNSTHRYSYMPAIQEDANSWFPHRWVIEAMRDAVSAAEQPAPVAVAMPDNLESHRRSWIAALDRLIVLETDADELLFWQHEHSALRDMYADLDRLNGEAANARNAEG